MPWCGLERPVELHTSQELERVFLRWQNVERFWDNESSSSPQERILKSPRPFNTSYILTGGRWALFSTLSGVIYYLDLESEDPTWIPLISCVPPGSDPISRVCFDESRDSAFLSFRIAICIFFVQLYSEESRQPPSISAHFMIYQVTPILDEHHRSVGLSARSLTSFQFDDFQGLPMELSLQGDFVACHLEVYDKKFLQVHVFEWTTEPPAYILRRGVAFEGRRIVSQPYRVS